MANHDLDAMMARHAELDKQIRLEADRRVPDEDKLAEMKREKLSLKDQIEGVAGAAS